MRRATALLLLVPLLLGGTARAQDGGDLRGKVVALEREIQGLFAAGRYEEAAAKCREEIGLVPDRTGAHYNLACALARLGKTADALTSLKRAVELGYADADHMASDPDLESLRAEKDFRALLEKAKGLQAAAEAKLYDPPRKVEGVKTAEGSPEGGLAWRLRLPETASKEKPARLIVWLHPSGGAMNQAVEALSPKFAEQGYALLVMTRKQWAGWSDTDAKRLLEKTLPDVGKRPDVNAERPILLGFSAGGQMALILYDRDPGRYGGLILDAAYPVDMQAYRERRLAATKPPEGEAAKKTPILVFVGDADNGSRIWDLAEPVWRKAGVPLTIDRVAGGRHEWLVRGDHLKKLLTWLGDVAAGKLPTATQEAPK